jgi:2-isopropylmalate synthase
MEQFKKSYFDVRKTVKLSKYSVTSTNGDVCISAKLQTDGKIIDVIGEGNGPISAFFHGLKSLGYDDIEFKTYEEHALTSGVDAEAVTYIELIRGEDVFFGVGQDKNTTTASLRAILCAINRMIQANN